MRRLGASQAPRPLGTCRPARSCPRWATDPCATQRVRPIAPTVAPRPSVHALPNGFIGEATVLRSTPEPDQHPWFSAIGVACQPTRRSGRATLDRAVTEPGQDERWLIAVHP